MASWNDSNDLIRVPERVGRYEVLLPIASGGTATVYLARSRGAGGFERDVALKLTHPYVRDDMELASDLLEEAKLAGGVRHPNVVPILDIGDDPFGLFLVMEYVEGETLSGLLRRASAARDPLPVDVGLRALLDALAGLHAAHEMTDESGASLRLVHRDFSPQNILVGLDGMGRLADFGIAKAASRAACTRTGNLKGKIAYMAPEQARALPIDRRADVWAAGVIAWEIVAGRRLYTPGLDDVQLLLRVITEPPPLLRAVRSDAPPALEQAIASALTMDPADRTPTAAAFARALTDACRRSGIDLPGLAEVGARVQRVVGDKLAQRRARTKEVLSLRAQLGRLAETGRESILVTPVEMRCSGPTGVPLAPLHETLATTAPIATRRGGEPALRRALLVTGALVLAAALVSMLFAHRAPLAERTAALPAALAAETEPAAVDDEPVAAQPSDPPPPPVAPPKKTRKAPPRLEPLAASPYRRKP